MLEEIVNYCGEAGVVKGEHMSPGGSLIQTNAEHHSRAVSGWTEVTTIHRVCE